MLHLYKLCHFLFETSYFKYYVTKILKYLSKSKIVKLEFYVNSKEFQNIVN